jgi:photosystem II stability/assembly factor-like uncharacterized protein
MATLSQRLCILPALLLFPFGVSSAAQLRRPHGPRTPERQRQWDKQQEEEERDLAKARSEWFYGQRAYPREHVPANAHATALKQLNHRLAALRSANVNGRGPTVNSLTWTPIGPQPIDTPYTDPVVTGRVSALAVDPRNSNTVYLGGAMGGVWKTTDGGTTWTPLTDTQTSLAVGSIVLDPGHPDTVFVGTGEENFSGDSYYGAGILKSTNGGASWTQLCGPFCGPVGQDSYYGGGAHIGGLAVHPTNGQVLLAAVSLLSQDGIYRSIDGGVSWTQVLSGNPGTAVIFDPTNGNVAFAALGNSFSGGTEGVYKSTNGGQTWSAANGSGSNTLPLINAGRIVLAMAASSTQTLYAGVADVNSGNLIGIYKTTDGGANWTLTSAPDYCTPQCWYDNVIAVQPTSANVVYAGGAFSTTLIQSLDGGATWSTLQSAQNFGFLHADMHALAFSADGGKLYLGNDGGAYSTTQVTNVNPTFTALNSTLSVTQFYPGLSIQSSNPSIAIGGTQDNGTVLYSGGSTWSQVNCGDGGYTAIDFTNSANYYAACQLIDIEKSTSSGAVNSWNLAVNGINTSDRVDFIAPLVMDPSHSSTLYFGTYRVYRTADGANTWTAISPDLTNGSGFWALVTAIAVAPSDSNTVYAGTGDSHVQVTTNASAGPAAIWADRSTGLPPRTITQVAVDPLHSTTAYVTFSGFTGFGDSLGHVFRTTNAGSLWADISGDLPNTPVNALVVDPDAPNLIFVGTDVGVFYTTNGGASWTPLVNGLPRSAVLGLVLHRASNTLRASTHGRGVWDLNVSSLVPLPAALSPAGLSFAAQTLGTSGPSRNLTVTNNGQSALTFSSIGISGANAADFGQANTCPLAPNALAGGANCVVTVTFTPTAAGPRKSAVSIVDTVDSHTYTLVVTGVGSAVSFTPLNVAFGNQAVGLPSSPQAITVTNKGTAVLHLWQTVVTGTNAADFSKTSSCGSTLAAGANCSISVTFAPGAAGARSARLLLSDDGGGSPQSVNLTGNGT